MRKFSMPLFFVVVAALLMTACSGAPTAAVATTVPTTAPSSTTAATAAASATAPATAAATDVTASPAATTGTPAATTAAGSTGTPAATTEATQATTGTPAATQSSTGGSTSSGQFVRLSQLLAANVNGSDNTLVGHVTGILVQHPPVPAVEQATPDAKTTPTPAPTLTAEQNVLSVRYVLVSAANPATNGSTGSSGNIVAVPWQAFNFSTMASGSTSTGGSSSTPATAALSIASSAFGAAPRTSLTDLSGGGTTWVDPANSYWTAQGAAVPAGVGADAANNLFLITSSRSALNIADQADAALGTTTDAYIDAQTGQLAYIAFNGGATFGNKNFIIPAFALNWSAGGNAASMVNRGLLSLNIPSDILSNAPSFADITGLLMNQDVINQLNQFWLTIQHAAQ